MTDGQPSELFERVLVPVASEEDARRANSAIIPSLPENESVVIVVHVIKTAEGGIDPSPVDLQEEAAERLFDIVTRDNEGLDIETRKAYGDDVAGAIVETARESNATVIAVSPRETGLLVRLLTGDTTRSLVSNPEVPVLAIPPTAD